MDAPARRSQLSSAIGLTRQFRKFPFRCVISSSRGKQPSFFGPDWGIDCSPKETMVRKMYASLCYVYFHSIAIVPLTTGGRGDCSTNARGRKKNP